MPSGFAPESSDCQVIATSIQFDWPDPPLLKEAPALVFPGSWAPGFFRGFSVWVYGSGMYYCYLGGERNVDVKQEINYASATLAHCCGLEQARFRPTSARQRWQQDSRSPKVRMHES